MIHTASQSCTLHTRRRVRCFRILCVLFGFAVGLGTAEILVRVSLSEVQNKRYLKNLNDPAVNYHCYSSNPNGEFSQLPEIDHDWILSEYEPTERIVPLVQLSQTPFCVEVRHNNQGYRANHPYSRFPQPGVQRIAFIGDSFVEGIGVPLNLSLPSQVNRMLGEQYEVLNAGLSGLDNDQEIDVLKDMIEQFHCNRVVFVFYANDVPLVPDFSSDEPFINEIRKMGEHMQRAQKKLAWYHNSLRIFNLLGVAIEKHQRDSDFIRWYQYAFDKKVNEKNLKRFKTNLTELARVSDSKVVMVLYPPMVRLESEIHPLQQMHDVVAEMAVDVGLPVLDLFPYFRHTKTTVMQVHSFDLHPSGRAHAIAAEAIVSWLREDVPGFLESP